MAKLYQALTYLILFSLVAVGFALRLYHFQFYLNNGGIDSMYYIRNAVKYTNGEWFRPSLTTKGPLFTILLFLVMETFGPTFLATRLVSLLFGGLLSFVVYLLGSELFNKKVGLLAALIVTINPLLIFYSTLVYREILYSFIWLCCIYFALRGFKGDVASAIMSGIFFALSILTIEIGMFIGIGFLIYLLIQKIKKDREDVSDLKNLDIFFCFSFLTLVPFMMRDYLAFNNPIAWVRPLAFRPLLALPIWVYVGFMFSSALYVLLFRVLSRNTKSPKVNIPSKIVNVMTIVLIGVLMVVAIADEIIGGLQLASRSFVGLVKFAECLVFPESLGLLLIFLVPTMTYMMRKRALNQVSLSIFAFIFCVIPLASSAASHYMSYYGLSLYEVLISPPAPGLLQNPFENAYRYIMSYIPFLSIFASYGILLFAEKIAHKTSGINRKRRRKNRMLEISVVFVIVLTISAQFFYADMHLPLKAGADSGALERAYDEIVDWFSNKESPVVYSFNPMFKEQYGANRVILLTDESLADIVKRANREEAEYIISDIFGVYSEAQISLFFGGWYEDESWVGLKPFALVSTHKNWPGAQIYSISAAEINETALVVGGWGEPWISVLSQKYFVETVDQKENLAPYFFGDFSLIVLADVNRHLGLDELNALQEKVANGTILLVSGLSPFYMNSSENREWLGGSEFVEAPKEAKWDIAFTADAIDILDEIFLNKSYALHTQSSYSSPTGCKEIESDTIVYARRIQDDAVAIYAKPYFDGSVIFCGIRQGYASAAEDYDIYTKFLENLLETYTQLGPSPEP